MKTCRGELLQTKVSKKNTTHCGMLAAELNGRSQRNSPVLSTGINGELTTPSASTRGKPLPRGGELASAPNQMALRVDHRTRTNTIPDDTKASAAG